MHTQEWTNTNFVDDCGNPAGGWFKVETPAGYVLMYGEWQNGPLVIDNDASDPNGVFVETLLRIGLNRVEFYQSVNEGRFACGENTEVMYHVNEAIKAMQARSKRREAAGILGTHEGC